jgi:type II secretory pathway pseudopilin PulG
LIELMVVITIIGILAGVLFASFSEARMQSRDKARMVTLKEVQLALELYKAQYGRYPEQGCPAVWAQVWSGRGSHPSWGCNSVTYINGAPGRLFVPDFISSLPADPNQEMLDGLGYIYRTDAAGTAYKFIAHQVAESLLVDTHANEFARCPYDCGEVWCGATPQNRSYAVYSPGAECW